jgi:hypothetical protein
MWCPYSVYELVCANANVEDPLCVALVDADVPIAYRPPPIVVEDPPSSDDAGDEKLGPSRRRRNAKLNG